jgi:RNA polymerase sigma factor (sigma-70 family)
MWSIITRNKKENNMPIRETDEFCSHFLGESEEEANDILLTFDKDLTMLSSKVASLTGLDKADLKQEGIIGLARARKAFEEGRGAAFRTLALYKIKDAMREYVTKSGGMRIPQYLKDAAKLVDILQRTIEKGTQLPDFSSYVDVWKAAKAFNGDKAIADDVVGICTSIKNLADRSHTTPIELLERAEITPTLIDVPENANMFVNESIEDPETNMIDRLTARSAISEIRKILTPSEFELLYLLYVEGKTERELEDELGVKAATIAVRLKNVLAKVHQNSERILNDTSSKLTKIEDERSLKKARANN